MCGAGRTLKKAEYDAIARLRYAIRRFLRSSDEQARASGLTHQQFEAMVAVRGFPGRDHATMGELAERLQIKPHSAVELVDRLEAAGLMRRESSDHDRRRVCVFLTARGQETLEGAILPRAAEWIEVGRELQRELDALLTGELA